MQDINDILENMTCLSTAAENIRMLKNWSVLKEIQNALILIHNITKQRIIITPPEL